MAGTVHFESRGRIAVITVDHAPVNALGRDVRAINGCNNKKEVFTACH